MSAAHVGGFTPLPGTNFSVGEEPQIVSDLKKLGEELGVMIYGISGYRTSAQSVAVGGSANDPHTKGEAADIGVNSALRESATQLSNAQLESVGLERPFDKNGEDANEVNHVQLKAGAGGGVGAAVEKGIDSAANPFSLASGVIGSGVKTAGELLSEGANDLGIPTPESIAKGVVTDVVEAARPQATRVGLYAVLILGAVAMMVFGFSEMLKPVGGPDLAGKARSAGKLALVGAEA